ncbi:hypothetical protein [Streptomyces sp. TR06-5]|uniref:hypothetical protein n=1 Tax=unclassified Streptomyces TaxID=2593676 RepID=UPI0039A07EC3
MSGRTDEVELALMQAQDLIDSTVSLCRSRTAAGMVTVTRADDGARIAAIVRAVAGARHNVSVTLPTDADRRPQVFAATLAALREAAGRGVTVRLLCSPRLLRNEDVVALGRRTHGCEVRLVHVELQSMLVADGRLAVVRHDRSHGGMAVFRVPAAVGGLDFLFAGAWGSAARLTEFMRLQECLRSGFAQRILERLCAGCKDGPAARELSVSLRTYRRHVAEIMRVLGAGSRFQAGVRAVELGLVPGR